MNTPSPPIPSRPRSNAGTVLLTGILIMLLGLTWLFSNLGYIRAVGIWPVILILVGLGNLLGPRQQRSLLGPLAIAAGALAFVINQGWLAVPFWAVFPPAVLVMVGASVIWRSHRAPALPGVPSDAYITTFSIFSGSELRPSLPFEGAHLTAVMGGAKLDLSRTPMAHSQAAIEVFACMGGVEIIVPPDWQVTASPFCFMGGVADKRRAQMPPTKHLLINGSVLLGGIEIKD